jgi:type III secretory pathway component EscV
MKAVLDLNAGQILGFAALSFLIMLLIEGVLFWRLSRRRRGAEETGAAPSLSKEHTTKELDAARVRVLTQGMPSVTEQTTRTLEPIYSERKPK